MNNAMKGWLQNCLYYFLPGYCTLCGSAARRNLDLCSACEGNLPRLPEHQCHRCAIPLACPGWLCGNCTLHPPAFEHCFSLFEYRPPVDYLITQFKHHHNLIHGKVLSHLLADAVSSHYENQAMPELLIPVPLHKTRLRCRGYNQSAEIADAISDRCGLPVENRLCRRIRDTGSQQSLGLAHRQRNVRGAFRIDGHIAAGRIAIVDDVLTTGSTANEMAKILLERGVYSVHVLTLARTPEPVQPLVL